MKISIALVTVALGTLGCASTGKPSDAAKAQSHGHGIWKPATASDSRSPCPGLNTLANHGYLPRNGKNITPAILNSTLQEVLNFEPDMSGLMAATVIPIIDSQGEIKLADLALHGFIEHDGSLVHDDVTPGQIIAPTNVNQTKVAKLLSYANSENAFTYLEFSRARANAEILSRTDANVTFFGAFEPAVVLQTFGRGSGINITLAASSVASFFGKERLPLGFVKQANKLKAEDFFNLGAAIKAKVEEFKGAAATSGV